MKKVVNKRRKCKRAQVWIETVIYTLIAFVMIGLVLSFAKPKIEEIQDKTILEQSTAMLKEIDSIITNMGAEGNQRIIEIGIKKGELLIDAEHNNMSFRLESKGTYSEIDTKIYDGNIMIVTKKGEGSGYNVVTLTRDYNENYDLEFNEDATAKERTISQAATSYKLKITNKGETTPALPTEPKKTIIDISLI